MAQPATRWTKSARSALDSGRHLEKHIQRRGFKCVSERAEDGTFVTDGEPKWDSFAKQKMRPDDCQHII